MHRIDGLALSDLSLNMAATMQQSPQPFGPYPSHTSACRLPSRLASIQISTHQVSAKWILSLPELSYPHSANPGTGAGLARQCPGVKQRSSGLSMNPKPENSSYKPVTCCPLGCISQSTAQAAYGAGFSVCIPGLGPDPRIMGTFSIRYHKRGKKTMNLRVKFLGVAETLRSMDSLTRFCLRCEKHSLSEMRWRVAAISGTPGAPGFLLPAEHKMPDFRKWEHYMYIPCTIKYHLGMDRPLLLHPNPIYD